MRVVNRKEFLSLREGTVYSKFRPCTTGNLEIKADTMDLNGKPIDWVCLHLDMPIEGNFEDEINNLCNGVEIPVDMNNYGRDGCYDEDEQYLVWSDKDTGKLIDVLKKSLER